MLVRLLFYKYNIPERAIVKLSPCGIWLSTEAKPRSIIIFRRATFFFIIPNFHIPTGDMVFIIPNFHTSKGYIFYYIKLLHLHTNFL